MAALEVDLSKIEMGQTVTVKWRGKPVFVRRRSEAEVEAASKVGAWCISMSALCFLRQSRWRSSGSWRHRFVVHCM